MASELMLGRIALWCGFLMMFGVFSDSSSWVRATRNTINTITDAKMYNVIASVSGVVALTTCPRIVIPVLSLVPAFAAIGLSIFVFGHGVWARLQGEIWLYADWRFAGDQGAGWVAYPARGTFIFALLAVLGALATLGLPSTWLLCDRVESAVVSARRAL